jgi:hypothetical protein
MGLTPLQKHAFCAVSVHAQTCTADPVPVLKANIDRNNSETIPAPAA